MRFPDTRAALYSRLKRPGPWVALLVLLGLSYFGGKCSGSPWRWGEAAGFTFFLTMCLFPQPSAWQWSGDERLRPSFGRGWLQAWAFWGCVLFLLKLPTWQWLIRHPLKFLAASVFVTVFLGPIGYVVARWEQHATEARKAKALAQATSWMRHRGPSARPCCSINWTIWQNSQPRTQKQRKEGFWHWRISIGHGCKRPNSRSFPGRLNGK